MTNANFNSIRQHILAKTSRINSAAINYAEFGRTKELKSKIVFGRKSLLSDKWLTPLIRNKESRHFIITDSTVGDLYAAMVKIFLYRRAVDFQILTVSAGEKSKSLRTYEKLSSTILNAGVDKNSYIIGFGGGVVNNIAGFLASTLYRGIGLIQIPTSLLAQVDVAIDFKQAINGPDGKNLIGSYYPAEQVVIDPDLLQTLPARHLKNGLAESIKHALTQDIVLNDYLFSYKGHINKSVFLDNVIARTVNLKIMLLNDSLNSDYAEMLPQYGHAIGHALEQLSNYKLLHGEAIAIGMCVMAEAALLLGVCDRTTVEAHYKIMRKFGLPTKVPHHVAVNRLLSVLQHDKHFSHGTMKSILVSRVGSVDYSDNSKCVFSVENDLIRSAVTKNRNRIFCR